MVTFDQFDAWHFFFFVKNKKNYVIFNKMFIKILFLTTQRK